ncbi:MAG: nucleoside monophosphate kinase [bacterium]
MSQQTQPPVFLIFGMQGSGKGTQSKLLQERYHLSHLAPGDIFREEIALNTELGLKIKEYVTTGRLVPDEITIAVLREYFKKPSSNGWILDGFPRNQAQQEGLDALLQELGFHVAAAIYLDIDDTEVTKRLLGRRICATCKAVYNIYTNPPKLENVCDSCGGNLEKRSDENEEAIKQRIAIYKEKTEPLLERYRQQGVLLNINGSLPIDQVQKEVIENIDERIQ